jgi:uncharacterized protein YegP (UPF0339 family)
MQNPSSLCQRNKARGGFLPDMALCSISPVLGSDDQRNPTPVEHRQPGQFEVFSSPEGGYWFRLVDSSGATWATSSETFATKGAVAAAIALVREIAGTGLVRDQSTGHSGEPMQPGFRATQAAAIRNGSSNFLSGAGHFRLSGRGSARAHR